MSESMIPDTILILDFGSQYSHLIGKRIRELNVYSEILSYDVTPKEIEMMNKRFNIKGIIISGGPLSVYDKNSPILDKNILELKIPILGICYGHQLLAYLNNGKIQLGNKKEYGITEIKIDNRVGVLENLNDVEVVWMSHKDIVYELPKEYEILAHSDNCPIAAFRHVRKPIYGLQWHPEVIHTKNGTVMLQNFIFNICKCTPNWHPENIIEKMIEDLEVLKDHKSIMALSGGIDSSTTAILASRIIGKNLTAVFVDTGFMRLNEVENIQNIFKKFDMNLITIDAKERFIKKIKGITDPELKRKIIGEEFIRVFEEISNKIGAEYLLQGTIYPDRVESGIKRSEKIKTHHNVGGLPSKTQFKAIIEPIKDLYKNEVRKIAEELGLPKELVRRQPFPGPGLAVRIMGEVTEEKIKIIQLADEIVRNEIEKTNVKENLWQYFAVLTNTESTGVQGDARAYGFVVAIRAVESNEAMTANFAKIPYHILEKISSKIINEIPQVTRVVYDITHKPPSTIEWE